MNARKVPVRLEFQDEVYVIVREYVINEVPQSDGSIDVILEGSTYNTTDPDLIAIVPAFLEGA